MDPDIYFVVTSGEDGVYIHKYDSYEALLKEIQPFDEDAEDGEPGSYEGDYHDFEWLGQVPSDWNAVPEGQALIIRGRIVVPRPVERVTRMEL